MEGYPRALKREERVTLFLRGLYEQHGYKKYRMGRFEEYDLYRENKNFLKSQHIITFNDLDGRVMALKPDVTLSIVKNTHAGPGRPEKFYYLENVYRLDKPSGAYREISQLGLESIGLSDAYAAGEVLTLAMQTLDAISPDFRMQLSHAGFVPALLEGLSVPAAARDELTGLIRRKNAHELSGRAQALGVPLAAARLLAAVCGLCGPFLPTLEAARALAITPSMNEALDQLASAYSILCASGCERALTLDFSLVADSDYYSGLFFQGYVQGIPRAVLAGGGYGNLMRRFGREVDAIGFAVYLNELTLLEEPNQDVDVDILLLYAPQDDPAAVAECVQALVSRGLRVRAERDVPPDLRYARLMKLEEAIEDA